MQTKCRENASMKEQFKQKPRRLRAMNPIGKMLTLKKQYNTDNEAETAAIVQTRGRISIHKSNTMQTMHPHQSCS